MRDTAIFLFDLTGIMAQPWLEAGYECWLFDAQHNPGLSEYENLHIVGGFLQSSDDVWKYIDPARVAFVCGFPPCTDLAVSGSRHFQAKMKANPYYLGEAMELVRLVEAVGEQSGAPWCLENPVGVIPTLWRQANFTFQPFEFGGYLPEDDVHPLYPEYIAPRDAYPKTTCLWSGNGFTLPPLKPVPPDGGWSRQTTQLGGKSLKTKNIRSATPRGFAAAVFQHLHNKV